MALQVLRGLDERISAHEPANERVIDAPVHVDHAHLIQMLVHREASIEREANDGVGGIGCAVGEGVSSFSVQ